MSLGQDDVVLLPHRAERVSEREYMPAEGTALSRRGFEVPVAPPPLPPTSAEGVPTPPEDSEEAELKQAFDAMFAACKRYFDTVAKVARKRAEERGAAYRHVREKEMETTLTFLERDGARKKLQDKTLGTS